LAGSEPPIHNVAEELNADLPADRLGVRQSHALLYRPRLLGDHRADPGVQLTRRRSRRLDARAA
jgi:hypothetical protein